ncbi:siderophore ferric iron reductase [Vibrio sp. EA2]|uniref:siderophore ferric iron reductase n=1 Tax=Vibrio sp. EA2 TaxID=3079860 RepID=UPI002949155E|nr:siderophore ferric iron reductase [Vibrio sp. EA2]MDV6250109.1 siderophore ferric iron reductase [Vibrio sp. EA2]
MSESFFPQLFQTTNAITPYLHGELGSINQGEIHTDNDINPIIQDLYQQLSEASPEAGRAYWLTRTWDLLCWQPVYVALISIYHLHSLPNLYAMAQSVKPCFVTGYRFEDESLVQGDYKTLISSAGTQIKELFDYYQVQMSEWTRIRPGFTHQLISDGILAGLIRLQQQFPQLTNDMIREHAILWLEALGLDTDNVHSLYEQSASQPLKLVRKSCCLVYKCEGRKLCDNCPRLAENKQLIAVKSDKDQLS